MQNGVVAERTMISLGLPHSHFLSGERISMYFLPVAGAAYELRLRPAPDGNEVRRIRDGNSHIFPGGLPEGRYRAWARAVSQGPDGLETFGPWSIPLDFYVHAPATDVRQMREREHRLSLMLDRDTSGVTTLIDPDAEPPDCPADESIRWFATPCYEGATMLVNEEADYYRDPRRYYLDCIDALRGKGVRFVTWHDVLDGAVGRARREVLLQFDVDGGPRSMERLYRDLSERQVVGTIMLHREARDWYSYRIEELDCDWLDDAERAGWAIGYHSNALALVQGVQGAGDYSASALERAAARFVSDVESLRRRFRLRTFTYHGGNVANARVPVSDVTLVCVDKPASPHLWRSVRTMFSDGGFLARPVPLARHVRSIGAGLHFVRNHPLKYANYEPPPDIPPRRSSDLAKLGLPESASTVQLVAAEREKERLWLRLRREHRVSRTLSHLRLDKPISERFRPAGVLAEQVAALRRRRGDEFLRQYPWVLGDPRVFWWRAVDAWCPPAGSVLSVGALPVGHKEELSEFLPLARVVEIDTDPARTPDLVMDVVDAPRHIAERFDTVLLFGLPYFRAPQRAVAACRSILRPGGVGVFGFAADTHPYRGGIWHPETRPVWKSELEPLGTVGLRARLWSFDDVGAARLFEAWSETRMEFFSHYWFVVARP